MDWTLLVIVDGSFVPPEMLDERIAAVARGGATWLQIRVKGLVTGDWIRYVREAGRAARAAGLPFLVNDRADVAALVGARGVHVGRDDLPVRDARRFLGPEAIVGATVRDAEAARRAEREGASYLGVGPQFRTDTKPELTPLPTDRIREIREATALPLVGIGGVDAGRASETAARGMDGMAVVSAVWGAPDPEEAARRLVEEFHGGKV
ncbi:MAG: thiamine phosphate synthase [Candidatus Eisenbacteria bacterium]|nr:thiamine phosphate synthase [Candidatus Eisenbacteria bacterium]